MRFDKTTLEGLRLLSITIIIGGISGVIGMLFPGGQTETLPAVEQQSSEYRMLAGQLNDISKIRYDRLVSVGSDAVNVTDLICLLDHIEFGPYTDLKEKADSMSRYYKFFHQWR